MTKKLRTYKTPESKSIGFFFFSFVVVFLGVSIVVGIDTLSLINGNYNPFSVSTDECGEGVNFPFPFLQK